MVVFIVFVVVVAALLATWVWINWQARRHGKRLADPTNQALQNRIDAEAYGRVGMTTWDNDPK